METSRNGSTEIPAQKEQNSIPTNSDELLTHEETLYIMRILMYGVTPGVAVLGIVGNIFSIIILLKHGLHKCSNILLISLAVTDLTFLVAFNSIPKVLYEVVGIEYAWETNRNFCFGAFFLYNIFNTLDYGMCYISLTMPMLITIERLTAVYLPFKFNLIITPARTWCAVAIVYIFWYSIVIYMAMWFTYAYHFKAQYNTTVCVMERSHLYYEVLDTVKDVQDMIDYFSMKIPPGITFVGCILISVKIKIASNQRKKMTQANSKETSSNRTTKMLLAVCVVYMITCAILSLPTYLPQYAYYTMISDVPSNIGRIMYQVINIAVCFNSSANFVVYVGMNKNFRDTYKSLFMCRKK